MLLPPPSPRIASGSNVPAIIAAFKAGTPLPDRTVAVPGVSGACMLVRREAIETIGPLDDRYFMHFEDLDWCLRSSEADRTVLFVPDAVAHHVGGFSSRTRPFRVEAYKHTSLVRFVKKNFTRYYPLGFLALVSWVVYVRWLAVVVRLMVLGRPHQQMGWQALFAEFEERARTEFADLPSSADPD